jgi:hypothetical protein
VSRADTLYLASRISVFEPSKAPQSERTYFGPPWIRPWVERMRSTFGAQVGEFLDTVAPYATSLMVVGVVSAVGTSAYSGYKSGGLPGAAASGGYAAANAGVDAGLVWELDPLIGIPAAFIYNKGRRHTGAE